MNNNDYEIMIFIKQLRTLINFVTDGEKKKQASRCVVQSHQRENKNSSDEKWWTIVYDEFDFYPPNIGAGTVYTLNSNFYTAWRK